MNVIVVPPDPRCDDCEGPVEEEQIRRSVRNGVAIGPWQCKRCQAETNTRFAERVADYVRQEAIQNNSFDTLCNEVDPKLAEAIHRARFA